ncbi:MAG TPA: hypothetical protein VGL17_12130 [Gemmatimonadaceae bacterium]
MIESRLTQILFAAGLLLLATSNMAGAQPEMQPPCCQITAIDTQHGVVTADTANAEKTFNFKFDSGGIPSSLKVGQRIWARAGKVSLNGSQNCCTIIPSATPSRTAFGIKSRVGALTSYSSDSAAHVRECNQTAQTSFPQGGHTCVPKGALVSSGKSPDGSGATYRWTCSCT